MAFNAEMLIYTSVAGLVGWLANNIVGRMSKQTEEVLPKAITSMQRDISEIKVTLEGIKNGFATRDKMDAELKEIRATTLEQYNELWTKLEDHEKEFHRPKT